MSHFNDPRNVGEIAGADAVGKSGSTECNNHIRFTAKIKKNVITDIKFKALGCSYTIAASSCLTELVKNKDILQSTKVDERELEECLGIFPDGKKPVLAVKPPATDIFEHILAAVDFSDVSERALKNAIRLTRAFESHLMVLHVIDDIEECLLYLDVEEEKQDVQLQWREQCSTAFDKLLKKTDFYDLPWEKIVRTGKPHEEIQTAAKEIHADLIVMGASGHSRLREILMGTTASKVSRALPCSLLTVKEEDVLLVTSELVEDIEDIETLYKEGLELLKGGFLEEAIGAFEHLLKHDMHFAPGWDAMAEAYKRLKQPFKAETCREHAEMIRQRLWAQKSDINSQ